MRENAIFHKDYCISVPPCIEPQAVLEPHAISVVLCLNYLDTIHRNPSPLKLLSSGLVGFGNSKQVAADIAGC